MSEHYFSQKPQSQSSPTAWSCQSRGKSYRFTSDHGVFSKKGLDFGSRLLIEQFREPPIEGDILDLGCGYGPIGIILADSFRWRHMVLADINLRALELARINAKETAVSNVEVVESDRFSNLKNRSFAAIVTNPPIRAGKLIVHKMFEEARNALADQGEFWVVMQKKQGAPSAKEKLYDLFGNAEIVARNKGYYILQSIHA